MHANPQLGWVVLLKPWPEQRQGPCKFLEVIKVGGAAPSFPIHLAFRAQGLVHR